MTGRALDSQKARLGVDDYDDSTETGDHSSCEAHASRSIGHVANRVFRSFNAPSTVVEYHLFHDADVDP